MNIDLELRPIEREDLPRLRRWRNDWRIIAWTRQYDMLNEIEHERWFERQSIDHTTRMYVIVMKAAGKTEPVGVCGLTSIDWRCRRAEFSIYTGPEFHKKGIGGHALSILLSHGFDNLGLNLIYGETLAGNPGIKLYERLGFQKEGTRRQFYFKDGKAVDAHLYSITAREWHDRRNPQPVPAGGAARAEPLDGVPPAAPREGDAAPTIDVAPIAPRRRVKGARAKEADRAQ